MSSDIESLQRKVDLFKQLIADLESAKGRDLDYYFAVLGGVVKKGADGTMDVLALLAGKDGDKVKKLYEQFSNYAGAIAADKSYDSAQDLLSGLKEHSDLSTADKHTITVLQAVADIKNGRVEDGLEKLFKINPLYSAHRNLSDAKGNFNKINSAFTEKEDFINQQISIAKQKLAAAESNLFKASGGAMGSVDGLLNSPNAFTRIDGILAQIAAGIAQVRQNLN